jgi:hypothetical protein
MEDHSGLDLHEADLYDGVYQVHSKLCMLMTALEPMTSSKQ